ncbi:MAG: sn-glycerol-3-phosphate ABC transporter ATP-binding protein UgpC [Alphaproteobacteria bacterium]|nr:sn-glycerol-3-phosphate ABC transporter ATP-binding protein UgpC [Alphaproteobacteria bacterium]
MAGLTLRNVGKTYGAVEVITGLNLDVVDGEFLVLVGPSGCGKSTLLRMIAGLEEVTEGTIAIGDRIVNDLAPSKRQLSMVFQSYALYPHMSVKKNLAFGLQNQKMSKAEIEEKVLNAARILQIEQLLHRKPRQLSGGQKQRVAIGRSIVREPHLFLFDEPLSNLDAELRVQMRVELASLYKRLKTTMIYVTHDQVEAMTLASRIVVLRNGVIEQVGRPQDLYKRPANLFVAGFIGSPKINMLPAVLDQSGGTARLTLGDFGDVELKALATADRAITVCVRPEAMKVGMGEIRTTGTIQLVEYLGSEMLVHFTTASGQALLLHGGGETELDYEPGQEVNIGFNRADMHFFDASESRVEIAG